MIENLGGKYETTPVSIGLKNNLKTSGSKLMQSLKPDDKGMKFDFSHVLKYSKKTRKQTSLWDAIQNDKL